MGDLLYIKNAAIAELNKNITDLSISNQGYQEIWNNIQIDASVNKFMVTSDIGKIYYEYKEFIINNNNKFYKKVMITKNSKSFFAYVYVYAANSLRYVPVKLYMIARGYCDRRADSAPIGKFSI